MKQVKITYQGGGKAGYTASIVDADTGEVITGFTCVDIHIDCNSIPVATFTVHAPHLDITALAAIAAPFNAICAWVAPTYQQARLAYKFIGSLLNEVITHKNYSELSLRFEDNSTLNFFSNDSYDMIRGRNFDLIVVEGYNQTFIDYVLKPTLMSSNAEIIVLGDIS